MRPINDVLKESVLYGGISIAFNGALLYLVSKGKYPDMETMKYFLPSTFLAGALLHIVFEMSGENQRFCKKFREEAKNITNKICSEVR